MKISLRKSYLVLILLSCGYHVFNYSMEHSNHISVNKSQSLSNSNHPLPAQLPNFNQIAQLEELLQGSDIPVIQDNTDQASFEHLLEKAKNLNDFLVKSELDVEYGMRTVEGLLFSSTMCAQIWNDPCNWNTALGLIKQNITSGPTIHAMWHNAAQYLGKIWALHSTNFSCNYGFIPLEYHSILARSFYCESRSKQINNKNIHQYLTYRTTNQGAIIQPAAIDGDNCDEILSSQAGQIFAQDNQALYFEMEESHIQKSDIVSYIEITNHDIENPYHDHVSLSSQLSNLPKRFKKLLIKEAPQIIGLNLRYNCFNDIELSTCLAENPLGNLLKMYLDNNRALTITDSLLETIANTAPLLKILSLGGRFNTHDRVIFNSTIPENMRLEELTLKNIHTINFDAFKHCNMIKSLTLENIDNVKITPENIKYLPALSALVIRNAATIELPAECELANAQNIDIQDSKLIGIVKFICPAMTKLNLINTDLESVHKDMFEQCILLSHISLEQNKIKNVTEDFITYIAHKIEEFPLFTLRLNRNPFSKYWIMGLNGSKLDTLFPDQSLQTILDHSSEHKEHAEQ
jgi:hypothetical protein